MTGDYIGNNAVLDFVAGSGDGATVCIEVAALADPFVEMEENFTVALTYISVGECIVLENGITEVTIEDSDGKGI